MKRTGLLSVISIVLLLMVVIVGCTDNQGREETGKSGDQTYIQIKGSDTEVNLVQHLAEVFMEEEDITLSVTGGGSGTGIAALLDSKADIANASRTMKAEEITRAEENNIKPVRVVIAMDGLSVFTHPDNPVQDLTLETLARIFKGEITNWQEVGGPEMKISLYGRQSNSGTYVFFRDQVLKGDYSADMKRMNGNAQIVEGVKSDKAGIGYVGVGYVVDDQGEEAPGINIINVASDNNSPAVSPLEPENVKDGSYPLARPLNQYINGEPTGAVLEFIKFTLSEKGQEIAVEEGFYPVSPEFEELNQQNLGL